MLCKAARGPVGLLDRFPNVKFLAWLPWAAEQSNKDLAAEALLQASMFRPESKLNMAWLDVEVGDA